ncbi:carboxymuconolactone decarboxylase family protein [Xylophilus sp.]|uniref:carboxymuconolactone decarboxylase family protein n=1 Tax=Xylophilus sp. TaxID=2653893 RepID=UPI0013B63B8E|nr:carboxymuconolactone decarboxylase family protein [Xylophilus sp.]KAF1044545.1 MAG: hypothetical protein GAK38_03483 [Xylophilus sp.]
MSEEISSSPTQARLDWTRSESMQTLRALAPAPFDAFAQLEQAVFRDGALDARTKALIAVAVTHVTQCEGCIDLHVRNALRLGATPPELAEAIWVAAELRAGAAIGQLRVSARHLAQDA